MPSSAAKGMGILRVTLKHAAGLLAKDINLFLENAHGAGTPTRIADTVGAVWDDTNEKLPGADIMAIYLLMRDGKVEGY